MRLINARTLKLESFDDDAKRPEYAILSHRWIDGQEVTLNELTLQSSTHKSGWQKIQFCCRQALEDGCEYVWIDTCCIDKTSSAELTEAINSMYRWYRSTRVCYAYLNDAFKNSEVSFKESLWFTRSWTLQELLAPEDLRFYDAYFKFMGTKLEHASLLQIITNVPYNVLTLSNRKEMYEQPIAVRMSWAATRNATRVEDVAYSLFGIFDVNLPLLYGEGSRAFTRLQEEIIRRSDDQSIFMWDSPGDGPCSIFAASPKDFGHNLSLAAKSTMMGHARPFSLTNVGLRIGCCITKFVFPIWLALFEQDFSANVRGQYYMFLVRDRAYADVWYRVKLSGRATCTLKEAVDLAGDSCLWPLRNVSDLTYCLPMRGADEALERHLASHHRLTILALRAEWRSMNIRVQPSGLGWDNTLYGLVLDMSCFGQIDELVNHQYALVSNLNWSLSTKSGHDSRPRKPSVKADALSFKNYLEHLPPRFSVPSVPMGVFAASPWQQGPVGAVFFDPPRLDLRAVILGFDQNFRITAVLITVKAPVDLTEVYEWVSPFVELETFKSDFYLQRDGSKTCHRDSEWLTRALRHAFLGESGEGIPAHIYNIHVNGMESPAVVERHHWRLRAKKEEYQEDQNQQEDHPSRTLKYWKCSIQTYHLKQA